MSFVFLSFVFIRLRLSYLVLISSCAYMYPPPFLPLSLPFHLPLIPGG